MIFSASSRLGTGPSRLNGLPLDVGERDLGERDLGRMKNFRRRLNGQLLLVVNEIEKSLLVDFWSVRNTIAEVGDRHGFDSFFVVDDCFGHVQLDENLSIRHVSRGHVEQ